MRLIDISRELLSAPVYPGDPVPSLQVVTEPENAARVSRLTLGTHSGTHMDAPLHFFSDGRDAASIPPEYCFGPCSVRTLSGPITGRQLERLLPGCRKRLLIHGDGCALLTRSAAAVLAASEVQLYGTDALTVGLPEEDHAVHRELLWRDCVLLEGLCLDQVPDGDYLLSALPLKIAGADGVPVRAVLLTMDEQA